MTITTLPALLAGMQPQQHFYKALSATTTAGRPQSTWQSNGCPPAGTSNTSLAGAIYTNVANAGAGQINRTEAGGGSTTYLAKFSSQCTRQAVLLLCDRIWDNGGITITSTGAQTINSPTWPARDANGQTFGVGVLLAVEVSATTGAASPTVSISYTNSAGTGGQTATNQDATGTGAVGDFFRMKLATGDVGVQSVQSLTLGSSWLSGTIHVVAYRIIATLNLNVITTGLGLDAVTSGLPVLYNGTFLFTVVIPQAANTFTLSGNYAEAQG